MKTLDECKQKWTAMQSKLSQDRYEESQLKKIVRSRVATHVNAAMKYFWASFALQIIVYSLCTHVIVTYWPDRETLLMALGVVLLYLPFTVVLMKKFKQIAGTKPGSETDKGASMYQYASQQRELLQSFYNFKRTYEFVLVPLSAVIGIVLTFKLYVPGGVASHPVGAGITFVVTMISCIAAIIAENKKSFEDPIRQLQGVVEEFTSEV